MSLLEAAADGVGGGGGGWRQRYHAEGKVLLAIAVPIVFSNLLTVTMGIVDLAFVGRIGKTAGPGRLLIVYRCDLYPFTLAEPTQAVTVVLRFMVFYPGIHSTLPERSPPFHSLLLLNPLLQPLSQSTPVRC